MWKYCFRNLSYPVVFIAFQNCVYSYTLNAQSILYGFIQYQHLIYVGFWGGAHRVPRDNMLFLFFCDLQSLVKYCS